MPFSIYFFQQRGRSQHRLKGSNHSQSRKISEAGSLTVWAPSEWGTVAASREMAEEEAAGKGDESHTCFRYPYTELLQWALLTCRFSLARFMVLSGEEAIAKVGFAFCCN